MAADAGSSARISFGDDAAFLTPGLGDLTVCLWLLTSSAQNAGNTYVCIDTGNSGSETEATNFLFALQSGTEPDGQHRHLRVFWESGAGVDTTLDFACNLRDDSEWTPVVVVRDATAKTVRVVTPYFDQTQSYTDNPTTTDTAATLSISGNQSGTSFAVASWYEHFGLFSRAFNTLEIYAFIGGRYLPNAANFGSTNRVCYAPLTTGLAVGTEEGGFTLTQSGFSFNGAQIANTRSSGAPAANAGTAGTTFMFPTSNEPIHTTLHGIGNLGGATTVNAAGLPNPSNCYADDGTYSTQAMAQRNAYINLFFDFDNSAIPSDAVILGAHVECERYFSTTSSGVETYLRAYQARSGGIPSDAISDEYRTAQEPVTTPSRVFQWFDPATSEIKDGGLNIHCGMARGGSLVAVTGNMDYCGIRVWWYQPSSGQLDGVGMTASAGTLVHEVAKPLSGLGMTGTAGAVTGTGEQNAEPELAGIGLTASAGALVHEIKIALGGLSMTASAGAIEHIHIPELEGIELDIQAGTIEPVPYLDATVVPTGVAMTITTNILGIFIDGWDVGWDRTFEGEVENWTPIHPEAGGADDIWVQIHPEAGGDEDTWT